MLDKESKYIKAIEKIYGPIEKVKRNRGHSLNSVLKFSILHNLTSENNLSDCPNCRSHLIQSEEDRLSCPNCGYQLLL